MRVIEGRNVNELYAEGLALLIRAGLHEKSRAGDVIVVSSPVMSVYLNPCERVLFDAERDANPFFHLMEGLWMLAGRDDSAFLDHYVKDFGERFAEKEDKRIHGAYGYRWRNHSAFGFDQLQVVIDKLKLNHGDRQAVIQMWDCRGDWYGGGPGSSGPDYAGFDDLRGDYKDRPCNTHLYLRVRSMSKINDVTPSVHKLDLTICCRSNDIVWGAYGANAVHMSMLQEYLAGMIGVQVGTMYQLSNNYHGYVSQFDKTGHVASWSDPYDNGEVFAVPMAKDWSAWDQDLRAFMRWHELQWKHPINTPPFFVNDWFLSTACHVAEANRLWKRNERVHAMSHAMDIAAPDWRRACVEWIERRVK